MILLMMLLIITLLGVSALQWWKLSSLQGQNAQLRTELARLRGKLRALQP